MRQTYAQFIFDLYFTFEFHKLKKAVIVFQMISLQQIQEILSLYKKHGWILRRILLSDKLKISLANSVETLFGTAQIIPAEFDAAWFSRASGIDREAWEIRHLSESPYAIVEVFDAEDEEEVREEARHEIEERLKERVVNKK